MAIEVVGAITVISDVGPTANSYASVAYTKERWALDPNKTGYTFTDEEIAQLAIWATNSLDSEYSQNYNGTLYDEDYALFWPRTGVYDRRNISISDYTVFPDDLINATAEQAFYLGNNNPNIDEDPDTTYSGVESEEFVGLAKRSYFSIGLQRSVNYKDDIGAQATPYMITLVSGITNSQYTSYINRG